METLNGVIIGMFAVVMVISLYVVFRNGTGKLAKDGTTKSGYFEDANGDRSSSRLTSYLMQFFFYVINLMVFSAVLADHSLIKDLHFIFMFLIFDFLLLLAIFVPSQLNKVAEITKLIELTKPEGVKQTEADTAQIKEENKS